MERDSLEYVIGKHILQIAAECERDWIDNRTEQVADSMEPLWEMEPEFVEFHDDEEDPMILVGTSTEATEAEQISRARRNPPGKAHPAEYRNHDVPVHVTVAFFPFDGLGTADVHFEQESFPNEPPAPDI